MWFQLRYLIGYRFWLNVMDGVVDSALSVKLIKGINEEYKGNKSWAEGKKEALATIIISLISLIIISCIF